MIPYIRDNVDEPLETIWMIPYIRDNVDEPLETIWMIPYIRDNMNNLLQKKEIGVKLKTCIVNQHCFYGCIHLIMREPISAKPRKI